LLLFHDKLHFYATYSICQVMCLDIRCASPKHKCRIMFWVLRYDNFIIFFSLSLCSWCLIYQITFWVWVACLLKYFLCFGKCLSCHLQGERYTFDRTVLTCQKGFSIHRRHQNETSVSINSQTLNKIEAIVSIHKCHPYIIREVTEIIENLNLKVTWIKVNIWGHISCLHSR
jgi:hypothetical protein